jgi:hypothetical protein
MKNTHSASATRLRRRLTSALLVLGLAIGTIAMTPTPVEAAGAIFTCYTRQFPNFPLKGKVVVLWAKLPNGSEVRIDQNILDDGGCAFFIVQAQFRRYPVRTRIFYMDTGSYYGAYYDGWSYDAWLWYQPSQSWYGYGSSTNGYALAGEDVWWLNGTVNCRGCQM